MTKLNKGSIDNKTIRIGLALLAMTMAVLFYWLALRPAHIISNCQIDADRYGDTCDIQRHGKKDAAKALNLKSCDTLELEKYEGCLRKNGIRN